MLTAAQARKSMNGQNKDRYKEYSEKKEELHKEYVSEAVLKILKGIEKEASLGYSSFVFHIDYFEPGGCKKYYFNIPNFYRSSAIKDIIKELKRLGYKVKKFRLDGSCVVYW